MTSKVAHQTYQKYTKCSWAIINRSFLIHDIGIQGINPLWCSWVEMHIFLSGNIHYNLVTSSSQCNLMYCISWPISLPFHVSHQETLAPIFNCNWPVSLPFCVSLIFSYDGPCSTQVLAWFKSQNCLDMQCNWSPSQILMPRLEVWITILWP